MRSRNLQRCGESRAGYNILNGYDQPELAVPAAPEPAGELKSHIAVMQKAALASRDAELAEYAKLEKSMADAQLG